MIQNKPANKEEVEKMKKEIENLDWETYNQEFCEVRNCSSCGAVLIKSMGTCWKCGEEV